MKKSLLFWATTLAVVGAMAMPVMARGGRGGGAGGAGGGRGAGGAGGAGAAGGAGGAGGGRGAGGFGGAPMDPAAQVQASLTNIQTALGMQAGDEWNVLSSKIQKVLEDQQKLAAGAQSPLGRGGGRGGMGGGAAAPAVDTTNALAVARDDLTKSVATGTTTADADLTTKLTAVRDNVKKFTDTLTTDQAALQKVCSVRQEAILVTLGVLN